METRTAGYDKYEKIKPDAAGRIAAAQGCAETTGKVFMGKPGLNKEVVWWKYKKFYFQRLHGALSKSFIFESQMENKTL